MNKYSKAEFEDTLDGGYTQAERTLLKSDFSDFFIVGTGKRPKKLGPNVNIRASLIREILVGNISDFQINPSGIRIQGANIVGKLMLDYCMIDVPLILDECNFEEPVHLLQSRLALLSFENSKIPEIQADRIEIKGNFYLRGARVDRKVSLLGATIGNNLVCTSASIMGEFDAQLMTVTGVSFLDFKVVKKLDLLNASLGRLRDNHDSSWPEPGRLFLDGTTYDSFGRESPNSANERLEWLGLQGSTTPQSYVQLARIFQHEGKTRAANQVLYRMEKKLAADNRKNIPNVSEDYGWPWFHAIIGVFVDALSGVIIGYGYRIWRGFGWLVAMIGLLWGLSSFAYHSNQMVPNSDVIITSDDWVNLNSPLKWVNDTIEGQDWETFFGLAYASDVVLPLIDFGQESAWAPSAGRSGLSGNFVWFLRWPLKLFGWLVVSLLLASATGILQSRHQE